MSRDFISKATRNDFREILVGFTLREIDDVFDAAGLQPKLDFDPGVGGQRRTLVEQYYAAVDFADPADARKVALAYDEVLEQLRRVQNRVANPREVDGTTDALVRRMARDGFEYKNGRFTSSALTSATVATASLAALTHDAIDEQIAKAKTKIESQDYAGAIANAHTLVEETLKELLRRQGALFNENEGDIRALYKLCSAGLNLQPKGESLENYLKAILEGLQKQVAGLYEVANKGSDRHARRYNPARHHAKLAVNSAFALCEFLLDSHEYQLRRKNEKSV